ncbi:TetR/AcrR family transcriptional regulator [Cryptosporangium minutisporangium]|uniref:TetR/AcrR family transcriptional regulator n=2 Tax=Cryptosporangium minutisporangium TaxID=113569 RepID=A0ABP6T894_9ACTN
MLVQAGFRLFGADGEAALTVRAVCREAELHTRYFYESFADTGALLAAVYDQQAAALGDVLAGALATAGLGPESRVRAGIRSVLRFISDDPRRGRVLFADTVSTRRREAETALLESLIASSGARSPSLSMRVAATMFTGAMTELARQWADGRLGDDLDAVVDSAVELSLALQSTRR